MKAFGYLRVSGRGQVDGDGFPRQRLAIEKYAAQHKIDVVAWFEERGVGGATEWEDRPAWAEMVARLDEVDAILVEQLDRLAREYFIQEYILRDLRKRHIVLVPVNEPDIDSSPSRILFRQVMGAIAEYDKTMIVMKLRESRRRAKISNGRCEGRKPYGHYPGEAAILADIREFYLGGASATEIARSLNGDGRKSRSGGIWHPYVIARILVAK